MAPRARIAVYKACWGIFGEEAGCDHRHRRQPSTRLLPTAWTLSTTRSVVRRTSYLDPVEVAFLFAADAGVFVAASAGNSGPTASTVAHNSPWITTVAAGTHDRVYRATATLGNGASYTGVGSGRRRAVFAARSCRRTRACRPCRRRRALCFTGRIRGVAVLDPAKVAGKIVVCDRGTNVHVNKSLGC